MNYWDNPHGKLRKTRLPFHTFSPSRGGTGASEELRRSATRRKNTRPAARRAKAAAKTELQPRDLEKNDDLEKNGDQTWDFPINVGYLRLVYKGKSHENWRFPEVGVPRVSSSIFVFRVFHEKPSNLGNSMYGNPHIDGIFV